MPSRSAIGPSSARHSQDSPGKTGEPVGDVHHAVAAGRTEVGGQVHTRPGRLIDQPVEDHRPGPERHHPARGREQLEVPHRAVILQQQARRPRRAARSGRSGSRSGPRGPGRPAGRAGPHRDSARPVAFIWLVRKVSSSTRDRSSSSARLMVITRSSERRNSSSGPVNDSLSASRRKLAWYIWRRRRASTVTTSGLNSGRPASETACSAV